VPLEESLSFFVGVAPQVPDTFEVLLSRRARSEVQ
jgi:hypothetical protein